MRAARTHLAVLIVLAAAATPARAMASAVVAVQDNFDGSNDPLLVVQGSNAADHVALAFVPTSAPGEVPATGTFSVTDDNPEGLVAGNDCSADGPGRIRCDVHWSRGGLVQIQAPLGGGDDSISNATGVHMTVDGAAGNDMLQAGSGGDILDGGDGNDTLNGGPGSDTLQGSGGNDVVRGGLGGDTVDGGPGDDLLLFEADTSLGSFSGGAGSDTLSFAEVPPLAANGFGIEARMGLSGGGPGGSTLGGGIDSASGSDDIETVIGSDGNDGIYGGPGNQTLIGGAGDDRLVGGIGSDQLDGGAGDDWLVGDAVGDELGLSPFDPLSEDDPDNIAGGPGEDTVDYSALVYTDPTVGAGVHVSLNDVADDGAVGASGDVSHDDVHTDVENIDGSRYDDVLVGDGATNVIHGGPGNDTLRGAGGRDTLYGDVGNDHLDSFETPSGGADVSQRGSADTDSCGQGHDSVRFDPFDTVQLDCETVDSGGTAPTIILPRPGGTVPAAALGAVHIARRRAPITLGCAAACAGNVVIREAAGKHPALLARAKFRFGAGEHVLNVGLSGTAIKLIRRRHGLRVQMVFTVAKGSARASATLR